MIVHERSQSLLLRTRNSLAIRSLLPKFKEIDFEGHNLAVRHGLDEVKVLRNLGIPAPPPILHYYDWPGPPNKRPLWHQKETAAFLTLYSRAFCFNEQGTMKTSSALWAADYLMRIGQVHRCLVVCPLSSLDVVWMEEIFSFLMHRRACVLFGSRERRLELLATDCDFYVINHHGVEIIAEDLRGRKDINLVIGDECDVWRNAGTDLYESITAVTAKRRTWLMSGTPFPNAPTDAWALTRIVNPNNIERYFSHWRRKTMLQVSQYKWVPRKDSYQLAYEAAQPAIRFLKKDCINLPPLTVVKRSAELSDEQKKAYRQMKNQAILEAKQQQITAVHAADKINKLRQILCGVVKNTATGEYVEIDHKPRLEVLLEAIQHAQAKVIVIVPFKGIIRVLEPEISALYSVAILNGDVAQGHRTKIINAFKRGMDPHVLLCHPAVMAHSLNLAEADRTIFYAPIYSAGQEQQVRERFARPGQKNAMTLVRIGASPLEWEIYRMLDERRLTQDNILSLYKHEILGIQ
jgi:SNF2 family DNA or RNA helicase